MYSNTDPFLDDYPVAALYSFNYESKEFHDGYGYLYEVNNVLLDYKYILPVLSLEGFTSCHVRFQMDLAVPDDYVASKDMKGAWCVSLKAFNKSRNIIDVAEDNLVICCFIWTVWCDTNETITYQCIFDLNQWYKEQMPGNFLL